jgi:hypothetical protein
VLDEKIKKKHRFLGEEPLGHPTSGIEAKIVA